MNTWPAPQPGVIPACQVWATSSIYRPDGPWADMCSDRLALLGGYAWLSGHGR